MRVGFFCWVVWVLFCVYRYLSIDKPAKYRILRAALGVNKPMPIEKNPLVSLCFKITSNKGKKGGQVMESGT